MARQARRHRLGPLHPSFDLLQLVRDTLIGRLPDDAHRRVSGRLGVSLTRVSTGRNVLVSEFLNREELVEALICSCFVPFYCGVVPPKYRGVRYVDGAASDNLPRCRLNNTITVSPYAGESDLCPRGSRINLNAIRFNNVSIQVNAQNMYRVTSTFFPPGPEAMAEICANGYRDALRFLQENSLVSSEGPRCSLETFADRSADGDRTANKKNEGEVARTEGDILCSPLTEVLPATIRKVLDEACRGSSSAGGLLSHVTNLLPTNLKPGLRLSSLEPVRSAYSLAQRLIHWIPDVPRDLSWLSSLAGDLHRQKMTDKGQDWDQEQDQDQDQDQDLESVGPLRRSSSLPAGLHLWMTSDPPLSPEATPTSILTFSWEADAQPAFVSLTPPATPTYSCASRMDLVGAWPLGKQ